MSESLIVWIKQIEEHLHELQILDVTVKVYIVILDYYKKTHRENSHEVVLIAIILAEIFIKICHDETSAEEISYSDETIMTMVYESTIKIITTTTITISMMKTCETLIAYYVKIERWSEAFTICYEVLKCLWLSITTGGGELTLSQEFINEWFDIAIRLTHCHRHLYQFEKTEQLLLRVFRATKHSLRIQDEHVIKIVKELVLHYESVKKSQKIIDLYIELLTDYSYTLERRHVLTMKTFYLLADLCIKHEHKEAEKYYLKICTNFDKNLNICHYEVIKAALALIKIYEFEKRWTDAQKIYSFLWRTILKKTEEYHITTERIKKIYRRYFCACEKELHVSYTILRQITIEFRTICVSVYESHSTIVVIVSLQLVEINERSETHVHEVIQIYEEIFRETHTIIKITIIVKTKHCLIHLYVTHCSNST